MEAAERNQLREAISQGGVPYVPRYGAYVARSGAREAEGTGLLSQTVSDGRVGSNPTPTDSKSVRPWNDAKREQLRQEINEATDAELQPLRHKISEARKAGLTYHASCAGCGVDYGGRTRGCKSCADRHLRRQMRA